MAYYILMSFATFLIVDYKYIYILLDKYVLYLSNGSKLDAEINSKNETIDELKLLANSKEYLLSLVVSSILLFSIIYTISYFCFSTNPILIKVFSKTIDVKALLGDLWPKFAMFYYISSAVFTIIAVWNIRGNIISIEQKLKQSFIKEEIQESEKNQEISYVIARDEDGECVEIGEEELYKNILITGSIGSGKTSGAISRICSHLIKSGKGGLILDAKGNFVDIIEDMCKKYGRYADLKVISEKTNSYFQLLDENISNEELATRIKQVLVLLSTRGNTDEYWLDKAENVLMNLFILMEYLDHKRDLMELHKLVTDNNYLRQKITISKQKLLKNPPSDKMAFELANIINFFENEYTNLDSRVISIIKSEITRFTIPLVTNYETYNQFCVGNNGKERINFHSPNIIVVMSINIGENKSLSKIISILLKLSFQKQVLSNISNPSSMFFVCDEYQEFVNVEDSYFLSLSREAKCINVISTQSYSSIKNTLKDDASTNVIIQNLVNKIWFRNDDSYTISEIIKQLGKIDVVRKNTSISENCQESRKYLLKTGFRNKKSSLSKTLSYVYSKENQFDENFFSRELKTFEALAFISREKEQIIPRKIIFERWNING